MLIVRNAIKTAQGLGSKCRCGSRMNQAKMKALDVLPTKGTFGIEGGKISQRSKPSRSIYCIGWPPVPQDACRTSARVKLTLWRGYGQRLAGVLVRVRRFIQQ